MTAIATDILRGFLHALTYVVLTLTGFAWLWSPT